MMSIVDCQCCHQRAFQLRQSLVNLTSRILPSTRTHDHHTYEFFSPRPSSYKYLFPLPRVPVRLYDHCCQSRGAEQRSDQQRRTHAHSTTRHPVTTTTKQHRGRPEPNRVEGRYPVRPSQQQKRPRTRISEGSGSPLGPVARLRSFFLSVPVPTCPNRTSAQQRFCTHPRALP